MAGPPYAWTVSACSVFVACAVALDATLGRRYLLPVLPRPPPIPHRVLRRRHLHPVEAAETAALRRRRLWCAAAGAAQGALALALGRLATAFPGLPVPGVALQALAVAALAATAASLLMEIRLIEIRRFPPTRGILAVLRGAVRVAAIVGFAAAVWAPDDQPPVSL